MVNNKNAFSKRHTTFILKPAGFISGRQENNYRHSPTKSDACTAVLQQACTCTAAAPFLQLVYLYILLLRGKNTSQFPVKLLKGV
jgi:hypothetical protein